MIRTLFGMKTVDGVLGVFHKTIDKLNVIADENVRAADFIHNEITMLADKEVKHQQEADRAKKIADRLTKVVNG